MPKYTTKPLCKSLPYKAFRINLALFVQSLTWASGALATKSRTTHCAILTNTCSMKGTAVSKGVSDPLGSFVKMMFLSAKQLFRTFPNCHFDMVYHYTYVNSAQNALPLNFHETLCFCWRLMLYVVEYLETFERGFYV